VVGMHYKTPLIGFLDPPDAFLDALGWPVERLRSNETDLTAGSEPRVVLFAPPAAR
ncbi:MAG: hypothetical protein JOY72_00170, partial [Actinobacteria bacterium]|nr:hypothetical protein [Actinomycetota bacterium]